MIEYTVQDLLKILLKKWFVIAAVMIAFGIAGIPLAKQSYKNAVEDYNAYTSSEVLDCKEEQKSVSSFCMITVKCDGESELSNEGAAKIVYSLLQNPTVKAMINNLIINEGLDELLEWEKNLSISVIEDSNKIIMNSTMLTKKDFNNLISQVMSVLENDIADIAEQKISINVGNITSVEKEEEKEKNKENVLALSIMEKPTERQSYAKVMITAAILGCIMGVLLVLVIEYIEENHRRDRELSKQK